MIEVGRLCTKTAGREAGKVCTVLKPLEQGFVLVSGPAAVTGVKRRKCSISHLEPLPQKLEITADAADADILKAYEKANVYTLLKLTPPTAEKLKVADELAKARKAAPKTAEPAKDAKKEAKKPQAPKPNEKRAPAVKEEKKEGKKGGKA